MAYSSTAKIQMSLQPFASAELALADMMLARESSAVTKSSLNEYVMTVERVLATAQKSNPKLAEPYVTQNSNMQGGVTQNLGIQKSFEKQYSDFVANENAELRELLKEVKNNTITLEAAKDKFVSSFLKKSEELMKKFSGYSVSEKKVLDSLEQLLKNITTAFPASRNEASKILEGKKPEQESPKPE